MQRRNTLKALGEAGAAVAATLVTGAVAADIIKAGEAGIWASRVALLRKQVADLDECIARLRSELITERRTKGGFSLLVRRDDKVQEVFATFQDTRWVMENEVIIMAIRLSLPPNEKVIVRDNTTGWEQEIPMPTNDSLLEEEKLA